MALSIKGMTAETVYQQAVNAGLNEVDAAVLVSGWIFENFGKTRRTFNYKEPFAEQEPGCVADFDRVFAHVDWIDGESVVQAETSAGEDGFNLRFHNIESDFDGIKVDVVKAFTCLAAMRESVFKRFTELRTELNRINSDIFECCNKGTTGPFFPGTTITPQFNGLVNNGMYLGNIKMNERDVALWQTSQGYMMLPTVYSIGTDFIFDPRVQNAGRVSRLLSERPEITERFGGPVSKRELIQEFGFQALEDGETLKVALEILPDSARYESLDALVVDLSEREASALRSRGGARAAAASAFGLEGDVMNIADAPVERLKFMSVNARTALARTGIDSMGELAKQNARQLQAKLKQAGFEATSGDVSEWIGIAKTLSSIR